MKFIFTVTTGRSGTAYLAELIARNREDCFCTHEILDPQAWGLLTPEVSQMMAYNHQKENPITDAFWKIKAQWTASNIEQSVYVETSHVLAKAGLVENLHRFRAFGEVILIFLHRSKEAVVESMYRRGDYACIGNMWLWLLDPKYPNNILEPKDLSRRGLCSWYVDEMEARARAFRQELLPTGQRIIEVSLDDIIHPPGAVKLFQALFGETPQRMEIPEPQNATPEGI